MEISTGEESQAREETGQGVHVVSLEGEDHRALDRDVESLRLSIRERG